MPEKLRLRFEKTGRAIYISHLDMMRTMQRVFARAGITPNVRYTSVDSRATFAMVQAGLGVSLNNQLITRGWDTTGIVILPVDPPQYAEIGIAAPAPEELSPAAKRFLAFARQTLRTDPEAAELGKEQA